MGTAVRMAKKSLGDMREEAKSLGIAGYGRMCRSSLRKAIWSARGTAPVPYGDSRALASDLALLLNPDKLGISASDTDIYRCFSIASRLLKLAGNFGEPVLSGNPGTLAACNRIERAVPSSGFYSAPGRSSFLMRFTDAVCGVNANTPTIEMIAKLDGHPAVHRARVVQEMSDQS